MPRHATNLYLRVVAPLSLICIVKLFLQNHFLETKRLSSDATHFIKSEEEPKLFNPFTDIELSLVTTRQPLNNSIDDSFTKPNKNYTINHQLDQTIYSSRHCIRAQDSDVDKKVSFVSRTCQFRNLYFHPQNGTFHYFPDPYEKLILLASDDVEAAWRELENDMTVAAGNIMRPHAKVLESVPPTRIWHPVIEQHSTPPTCMQKLIGR